MRRVIAFPCESATLYGTLDTGDGQPARRTGLLIVSGGNETRIGAHRGMALLAARVATDDVAVFRYDRRGVGDSEGVNTGFAGALPDLAAALAAFRAHAAVDRIVAYGNCDAATLLALEGGALGIDALVLSNPWTGDEADALPPAAAIGAGYAAKLRRPREWWRLLRGGVDLRKLAKGVAKIAARTPRDPFAARVVRAVEGWGPRAASVLARGDATAIAFADAARAAGATLSSTSVDTASHSFARPGDMDDVEAAIRGAIGRLR